MRADHLRDDQPVVVLDKAGDQLRVVRLLDEVELLTQVHLELVGERLHLQKLSRVGMPGEKAAVERSTERSRSTCSTMPGRRTLIDDLPTGLQQCAVRLSDRRRRERLRDRCS